MGGVHDGKGNEGIMTKDYNDAEWRPSYEEE